MTRILFFSRGRGHGHAIPDHALGDQLTSRFRLGVTFVSYSTGLRTLRDLGQKAIDLGITESCPFLDAVIAARRVIDRLSPDLVIAHEEGAALFAAHTAGLPSIFVSAFLPRPTTVLGETLKYASCILVLGDPGIFLEPNHGPKPVYVGSLFRQLRVSADERRAVRKNLGLGDSALMFVIVTGGAATERRSPIAPTVFGAYAHYSVREKRIFWVSRADWSVIKRRYSYVGGLSCARFYSPIENLILASDVLITKGTRGISIDAATLGVPVISLSHGENPIDDVLVPRMRNTIALSANAVTVDALRYYIDRLPELRRECHPKTCNVPAIADLLYREIRSVISR